MIELYLRNKSFFMNFIDCTMFIISKVTPKRNVVIFESHPDMTDNSLEMYKYMSKSGWLKEYQVIWAAEHPEKIKGLNIDNVDAVLLHPKSLLEKLKVRYLLAKASIIICSHRFIFPYIKSKNQLFLYLDHGSPLKDCKNIYENANTKNVIYITQSPFFKQSIKEQYGIDENHIIVTGLPRNDQLFRKYTSLKNIVDCSESYKKIILWAPTFRYHESKTRIDSHSYMPLGIPVIYTEDDLLKLDKYLIDHQILLLLKPHPAQDMDLLCKLPCKNIRILFSDDLSKYKIETNELLSQVDALITDYSSIYYDFLLLNRPVAITIDDFEQYMNETGFVFDNPLDVLKGDYIRSIDGIYEFIQSVFEERDGMQSERREILNMIDRYQDGKSTERVFNYIIHSL